MKRKMPPLRDRIFWIGDEYRVVNLRAFTDRLLRLIRDDRKRHCAECQQVKQMIEKQVEKLEKM